MATVTQIIQRRKRRQARRKARVGRGRWFGLALALLVLVLLVIPMGVAVGGALLVYQTAVRNLPLPQDTVEAATAAGRTQLYDRSGQTLLFTAEGVPGSGVWVTLDDLPPYVAEATRMMEDPDFLTATRFQAITTFSKLWDNLLNGPLPPDPSLTARLVRNIIAPPGEFSTIESRGREIALTAEINRRYSPEAILEWHLNTNNYGNQTFGIESAAQVYLGKHAADLTLDEAALLAAIPPAVQYNPFDNEIAARGRQRDLLRLLQVNGYITTDEYERAFSTQTAIQSGAGQPYQIAPEFAAYARRQAQDILDNLGRDGEQLVARGGVKIITSLDLDLYYQSECALRIHLSRLTGTPTSSTTLTNGICQSAAYLPQVTESPGINPPNNGGIAIIDVGTGEIKSLVGPVTALAYQPGPTLGPFVYFTGFVNALYNPATMVLDIPRTFPGSIEGLIYTPTNPDGRFWGPLNLRDAMGAGLLPPAVQVARTEGLDSMLALAHRIGLNSLSENTNYDLSLLERGGEVSLLDTAYAYSVFASMGQMRGVPVTPVGQNYRQRSPTAVLRIEDTAGNVLWEYTPEQVRLNQVGIFPGELGYLVNDILADSQTRRPILGENNPLELPRPVAVVNGLTSDRVDDWTIGYTPHLVVATHLDRLDRAPLTLDTYGMNGTAAVWRAVLEYANVRDSLPADTWERPNGVVELTICQRSGLLPNGHCDTRREVFLAAAQPTTIDTYWQAVKVNSQTGQRATANTPAGLQVERVYFIPPPEAADWWKANNLPTPPEEYDTVSLPELLGSVQILQPLRLAYVGGVVDVRGSLDPTNMQYYVLAYGQGLNPDQWIQIGEQHTDFSRGTTLGTWDTASLDGLYALRLSVVRNDNSVETSIVEVTVDNVPPQVTLTAGEPGQAFRWPDDATIPLEALVQDVSVTKVEFYHNGQLLGTDTEWPYGFTWDITRTGTETFTAVAFDQAGNSGSSEITVEVVRGGG
ncbi:MAG: transglycosylase domain-containing protein [Anaerolineaceae bacterium]|nr:transglycosylase domain-containing protein [Anaerolineaceae bacterium]